MRRALCLMALAAALIATAGVSAWACVGKTLQVGVVSSAEDRLLARILFILVNERTGTSIKLKEYPSFQECFTALGKSEIDIAVLSVGQGMAEVMEQKKADSATRLMDDAKQAFSQKFNLIWLEPWGVTDGGRFLRDAAGQPFPSPMAPLVRKDTIKEFPALSRLINKMSGRLGATRMAELVGKSGKADADKVARDYLKNEKLI